MTTFDTDAHEETFEAIRRNTEAWMTLGALREALSQFEARLPLVTDQGYGLGFPHSYRGYYDHLALEPRGIQWLSAPLTVKDLLSDLNYSEGNAFEGHKGGRFIMTGNTPVWVAHEGDADGRPICGVTLLDGHVVVVTEDPA